jgi:uncharacterized membrane protein YoaK (UPF0700 family)
MSDPISPGILLAITATTGAVDAVSVLAMGHVFTANMTGNVVFLGFAVAGSPEFSIPRSSLALVAFLTGAVVGGRAAAQMSARPVHHWIAYAFGVDGLVLLAAAAAAWWGDVYAVIGLTAIAMGFRNATVRKLGVADLTTTLLTLTLTGLAADSALAGGSNPRWQRRVGSVLTMFAGAVAGALLLRNSAALALGLCGLVTMACGAGVYRRTV